MDRYYYHGIEAYSGATIETFELINKILEEGLIARNKVLDLGSEFSHVCLYRKNEEFNYDDPERINESARSGWIDNCFVFIVSPEIEAHKANNDSSNGDDLTNLVDEWRSVGDIKPDKIVGLGLPYGFIEEELESDIYSEEERREMRKKFEHIVSCCKELGLFIVNSEDKNFTDKVDNTLGKDSKLIK